MGTDPLVTFSFGENWKSYIKTISEASVNSALADIDDWLGADNIKDKNVLDIGCGSGIHSLVYFILGARQITSFDIDQKSIEATKQLRLNSGSPPNWEIIQGSILDEEFVSNLGSDYDIVYSWGVLHHTGALWESINNACSLPKLNGLLWLAIYSKGPLYPTHLALKQKFNRASPLGKKMMIAKEIFYIMRDRWRNGQNPLKWNQKHERGMDTYHDLVDWLGGLPYEVASPEDVIKYIQLKGYHLERLLERPEGGNSVYLLSRKG